MKEGGRASGERTAERGRFVHLILALSVVAVASLSFVAPGWAAFPGQNGKIAFVSFRDGNPEIYTTNPDGSFQTRLTNDPAEDGEPGWSADGRRIAFTRRLSSSLEIYVMNADGSSPVRLTDNSVQDAWPSWSPDGRRIVFQSEGADGQSGIFVMDRDGNDRTRLVTDPGCCPAWSPDGEKIVYTTFSGLVSVNADGSGRTVLTNPPQYYTDSEPNWSPDGQRIVFARQFEDDQSIGYVQLMTMNRDGTALAELTPDGAYDSQPTWSPDGQKVAFTKETDTYSVYVVNANGTGAARLATDSPTDHSPDWQPIPHQSSPAPPFDHPGLASPLEVSLVPVHRPTLSQSQCSARGGAPSTHGAPLSFSSCNPPAYRPGTVGRLGPQSHASASLGAIYGDTNAANGDQANLAIRASLSDVQTLAGADYAPNPAGADATLAVQLRLTDTYNGPSQSDPATTVNFELDVPVECVPTAGPEGSNCAADTSADALAPGAIRENESMVLQVLRLRVDDAGLNATPGDSDDRIFATHGIYVP